MSLGQINVYTLVPFMFSILIFMLCVVRRFNSRVQLNIHCKCEHRRAGAKLLISTIK
jgi:hypothetical protein